MNARSLWGLLALLLLSSRVDASQGGEGPTGCSYSIEFLDLTRANVSATVSVALGVLEVDSYGAFSQPHGWGTFVEDLIVLDDHERPLEVQREGRLAWSLPERHTGTVRLSYSVDLSHAAWDKWPEGPRTTSAYTDGRALMVLSKALIVRPLQAPSATIEIRVPDGWKVTTPWDPVDGRPGVYSGVSLAEMSDDLLVVGVHEPYPFGAEGMSGNLVAFGVPTESSRLMGDAASRILTYYTELFGGCEGSRYLMVWFPDGPWETGEAYNRSYAAVWPEIPAPENVVVWSDTIAHEMLHHWNGHRFAPADRSGSQWVLEGFTEYAANLACLRVGVISRAEYYRLMEKHLLMYWMYRWNGAWERLSLVDAGSKKSDYNAALYDGGWLVAFCLDVLLREHSAGEYSFDHLLLALDAAFGDGTPYTNQDVISIASDLADADLGEFYRDHVQGTQRISIRDWLERAGCEATVSGRAMTVRGPRTGSSIFEDILEGR